MGSEARDTVGLAKISNVTKDYLTVLLTCSALESENQVKKKWRNRIFHTSSGVDAKAYLTRKYLHLYCLTPTWMTNQSVLARRFMYTGALRLMVQPKSLTHTEVLLSSLLFSLLFFYMKINC